MAAVPENIKRRIEVFARNIDAYKSGSMNETQLRREFIDPFFFELGWDVENKKGYADTYKDVIHEYSLKTKDVREAPDYCFRIGGTRKFFVESKKPSVNVKDDIHPAFQLRSYAWSAKLPLSILTDFEEFAVYDCRIPPNKKDKASTARTMYFTYEDYLTKWEEIEGIFSRDAILKGSFDKYVESNKRKRGTAEVDEVFLDQMEEWRKLLAKNIALRNSSLSIRELNYAEQKTIDRIIFLRICEDRGIEDYGQLMILQNGVNVYERLKQVYYRADEKYNSGLFHFEQEKERREPPDKLTLDISIDDKVLKDIFKNLYYPDSPYEFSVLPADILGQVYEQFLGKVIRLTPAHYAVIEDKPEVKKAGGVYYTPTYIVDYIINNTLGKLLPVIPSKAKESQAKDRLPRRSASRNDVLKKISKLKILDPACGSGSFLIGAFQYLLDWHLKFYTATDKKNLEKLAVKKNPPVYQSANGAWLLTTAEKKRILLNNIYGVDIDSQAVEVTKLSLLLKVLEGESNETIANQLKFFRERALPDLSGNVKCGNSLIGSDCYDQSVSARPSLDVMEMQFLDDEEKLRINVFDWNTEFKEIMDGGGFDVVIGNPPYGMRLIYSEEEKEYFKANYNSSKGSYENYLLFYEASLRVLKKRGKHGFIVPITWLTIPSAESLRKHILHNYSIERIVWLPELVFKNAQVNTLVSIISTDKNENVEIYIFSTTDINSDNFVYKKFKQKDFIKNDNKIDIFVNRGENELFKKIKELSILMVDVASPCSGYNPYEVGKGIAPDGKPHTKETVKTKPYHSTYKVDDSWKQEIIGRDLKSYFLKISGERWIKYGKWLAAQRDPGNFQGKRILVQEITGGKDKRIVAAYYEKELYHSRDVIPIKCNNEIYHPLYLLGILNSYLISWIHRKRNPKSQKGLFPKVLVSDLKKTAIPKINSSNKSLVSKLIQNVGSIIKLYKSWETTKTPQEQTVLQRQIAATDKQIDQLVYQLYGLSEKEIKIVEGN